MSRFFRSGDSTSTSSSSTAESESDSDDDNVREEGGELTRPVATPASTALSDHRDILLHALLEERCLSEVRKSHPKQHPESPEVRAEAQRKYRQLCERLASYNLISTGLDDDKHAATRQGYRDGLDVLSRPSNATTVAPTLRRMLTEGDISNAAMSGPVPTPSSTRSYDTRPSLPYPVHRLLTGPGGGEHSQPIADALGLPHHNSSPGKLLESRYHSEFEELGTLGRGGYGIVYHVRNRLDDQVYAIKKVPLSPGKLQRLQNRGRPELEEVLREVRTLARLDHPNIVRYYGGWIEWMDGTSTIDPIASDSRVFGSDETDANPGAEVSSHHRVRTESSLDSAEVLFEHSDVPSPTAADEHINDLQLRRTGTRSTTATVTDETIESVDRTIDSSYSMQSTASGIHFAESTLALHMQMALHPMTLADFLSPPPANDDTTSPLSHCFHLDPSLEILLAVMDGLEYLHGQGIVHRDIKPANIFIGSHSNPRATNGTVDLLLCRDCRTHGTAKPMRLEVRIGDFGLVSVASPEVKDDVIDCTGGSSDADGEMEPSIPVHQDVDDVSSPSNDTALARTITQYPRAIEVVGTEIYRAPTTLLGPDLDIYALGVVAFELLWRFETRMERLHTIQEVKLGRFPDGFCFGVNADQMEAVKRCIATMLHGKVDSVREVREMVSALHS